MVVGNPEIQTQNEQKSAPLPEWRLDDLYPGMESSAFAADLARAGETAKNFATSYKGRAKDLLLQGGESLAGATKEYELLQDLIGRLMSYASLIYAGDTMDAARGKFYGDTQERVTEFAGDLLFFELELNHLPDVELAEAWNVGELSRYRPWLQNIRKERPHQLADNLEQLFLEKSVTSSGAWNRLFDETLAALRFDIGGEHLTLERTLTRLSDPDEETRAVAAASLAKIFTENKRVFTLIINTLAKDKEISDRWRNFEDIADSRHLANRVEPEVIDALVQAVTDSYPNLSHRYYKLKATWFGKEKINHWDRNAPLSSSPSQTFSWTQARDTVLSAYAGFSPRMSDIAKRFFDEGWIDAAVRPGKTSGAFSHPTVPSAHPYVLVNFQGKPRDVMTLAHELGHGVHQVLAAHNGALLAPTPLTMAETASVFGEMLTFRALLASASDRASRKAMLAAKVEDMLNTVVRQVAFYKFERLIHTERRKGELTSDQISKFWVNVQEESLGPAIILDEGYRNYWTYIGHFIHSPFYVYAYAFGDCLVNSLYKVYEQAPDGFVEKYLKLLSAGGTTPYNELLSNFGLNAREAKFWSIGLSLINEMIDELESLN